MKEAFKKILMRIEKLLEIKSVITISLLYCFISLVMQGLVDIAYFNSVFSMIMGFYFGTQYEKNNKL